MLEDSQDAIVAVDRETIDAEAMATRRGICALNHCMSSWLV